MMTDETQTPTDLEEGPRPQDDAAASQTPEAADALPDDQPKAEEPPTEEQSEEAPTPPAEAVVATAPEPEPAPTPEPARSQEADDKGLFEAAFAAMGDGDDTSQLEGAYKKLSRGDRIEATVIQVDRDRVFVDLGTKAEGIVPLGELSDQNLESAKGHVEVGDKISVVVLKPEGGGDGNPIVSKKRADFEEAWDHIEEAFGAGKFITAQVIDRVKGGLVVDIGVRGFVPATHVGSGKLRNIEKFVGQPLQLKIIEIDRDKKKVVLSNRQAAEEQRARAKEEIFVNVAPGDILEGAVRRLTDYGAFVDLGGVDGLLHISEMSWARISHPREVFREGQKIKVMVLRLDPEAGKISLGHRQVLPDPWNLIKERYTTGQKLTCTISRIVQSGAFVRLPEGAEAFMPLSEMSIRRVRRPQDVVEENQEVEAQIIDLRTDERRMVLSMRAIGGGAEPQRGGSGQGGAPPSFDDDRLEKRGVAGKKGKKKTGRGGRQDDDDFDEAVGRRGFATGGATIGERLGMLKGFLGREEEEDDETIAERDSEQSPEPADAENLEAKPPEQATEAASEGSEEPKE